MPKNTFKRHWEFRNEECSSRLLGRQQKERRKQWLWSRDQTMERHLARPRKNTNTRTSTPPFDVARPKHVANILGGQDTHGWLTAKGGEGHETFETDEIRFNFMRRIRQKSDETPTLWLMLIKHILWNVVKGGTDGSTLAKRHHGQTTTGWTSQSTKHLQQMMKDFIEEAQRWELVVVEYRRRGDQGGHDGGNRKRTAQFPLEKQLEDLGISFM